MEISVTIPRAAAALMPEGSKRKNLTFEEFKQSFQQMKEMSSAEPDEKIPPLHVLLQGTDVTLPEPIVPERSPELEARVQRLRRDQENREYRKMTAGVDRLQSARKEDSLNFGAELREINAHLINILQLILTVGGTFLFTYKAIEYAHGDTQPSVAGKVLVALCTSFLVAVADLYFILRTLEYSEKKAKGSAASSAVSKKQSATDLSKEKPLPMKKD
ncbi:unnamed protein product [Cyprideis torosa]|uniref:Uncharacterized protein n=1 Tax=Cyprideis torosa TaxID=163714 RepID=A0A7R8WMP7_9CRUS|nr:unnamed protein product [Cyprideis torosa]CAG0899457.1 unnamed protein product [Cyprideis torosa]